MTFKINLEPFKGEPRNLVKKIHNNVLSTLMFTENLLCYPYYYHIIDYHITVVTFQLFISFYLNRKFIFLRY